MRPASDIAEIEHVDAACERAEKCAKFDPYWIANFGGRHQGKFDPKSLLIAFHSGGSTNRALTG